MKRCPRCSETKPYAEFYKDKSSSTGCSTYCKPCQCLYSAEYGKANRAKKNATLRAWYVKNPHKKREHDYMAKYGLTATAMAEMLAAHDNACAACGDPFTNTQSRHLDHCHATNTPRAFLCRDCNHGVGNVREDVGRAEKLTAYIQDYC